VSSHARFFAPAASAPGDRVTLPDDEAEHLTRVLRLAAGDRVRVFNGRGAEFESIVEAAGRDGVHLRVGSPRDAVPEPRVAVTLAQAVLKGDKMDDVVRDAVMIGVAAIQPIITAHTESSTGLLERGKRRDRWARIAVSSAKQCGRAVVPPILAPQPFSIGAGMPRDAALPVPIIMLVEPGAASGLPLGELDLAMPPQATLLVGPEGGWSAEEVREGAGFGSLVTLGQRTLRADAIALVALSALFARWGEL
jgi:16S rRNA (uracil1498-N3)-methyltransferase